MKREKKQRALWQRVTLVIVNIFLILVVAFLILIGVLFATEFKPADEEPVEVAGVSSETVSPGDSLTVLTWNIGYGALGDNADFFLDGGKSVKTADEERTLTNMDGVISAVTDIAPDVAFFQEVDESSMRSNRVDEAALLAEAFPDAQNVFAYNFRSLFIPYPVPPIGQVNGGILTTSDYEITDALRLQLPCPFSGIERVGNLKRCLLISRVPVEGTDRELVLVNLHLEAYDSGEGKVAQTAMLRDVLQTEYEKGNYVIAGGDFNQIFSGVDSSAYPVYEGKWQPGVIDEDDFAEGWQFEMDETAPSCRSLDKPYAGADKEHFQYYIIDGFLVSQNLTVDSLETVDLDFRNSDHNPVVMTVTLQQ